MRVGNPRHVSSSSAVGPAPGRTCEADGWPVLQAELGWTPVPVPVLPAPADKLEEPEEPPCLFGCLTTLLRDIIAAAGEYGTVQQWQQVRVIDRPDVHC